MIQEIKYNKEKVAANCKVSKELITDPKMFVGQEGMDYAMDTLTCQIETFIVSRLSETQKTRVYAERPTFLDWLLRRKRSFEIVVNAKEVIKNPPTFKGGSIMYAINQVDNEESN